MSTLKNLNYKYYYIYKIINLINKKCYIGFHATNKEYDQDNYFGSSKTLNNAIIKYNSENFIMGIIEYINVDEWKERERYWIKEMRAHISQWGYNLTWGGDGRLGCKHTEETKQKISKANTGNISSRKGLTNIFSKESIEKNKKSHLGKTHSEETKQKMSIATLGKNNGMYGKKQSVETKIKIGNIHRGKKLSKETKIKIGNAVKERIVSIETKNKLSNLKKGTNHSEESIIKMKISHGQRKRQICPYCKKNVDVSNYGKWHGDKCKFKNLLLFEVSLHN